MAEQPILSRLRAPVGAVQNKRRIGRGPGSGLGTTGGKGQKGQYARAGGQVRRGFEGGQTPLMRRLPKVGFTNPFRKNVAIINIRDLADFGAGAVVDEAALKHVGLVHGPHDSIKILGDGELSKALTVRAHAFSKTANERIESAGGKAELIAAPKSDKTDKTKE
jgi:large subunit ribosomal protein L15